MKTKPSLHLSPASQEQSRSLNGLLTRAQQHARAEQAVLAAVPENLRHGLRFVSCHQNELVLMTHSAIQASQVRFRQQEIVQALSDNELFGQISRVRVRVAPARHRLKRKHEPMVISNENARLLKEEAGHTKDKALREVLEKLASHTSKASD